MKLKKFIMALLFLGNLIFLLVISNLDIGIFNIMTVANAELKTYEGIDTAMSDFGEENETNVNTVKNMAKLRAEKKAQEKVAIFIGNFAGNLTEDDIAAVTSNIAKVVDVQYQRLLYQAKDEQGNLFGKVGYMYEATVTLNIDTNGISEYLNRNAQEKATLIAKNKNLQETLDEIDRDFEDLRKNSANKTPEQINSELEKINNEIMNAQKLDEENKFSYQKFNRIIDEKKSLQDLVGTYKGSYFATQGETGLTLTVYEENGKLKAIFDFYNLKNRTNAKSGKYYMDVSYDKDSESYKFIGYEWIERPTTYVFADLRGKLNGNNLNGEVLRNSRVIGSFNIIKIIFR